MGKPDEVVGVDGCKAGWMVIVLRAGKLADARVLKSFGEVLSAHPTASIIAVDMPIGLVPERRERVDLPARDYIGARLGASLFPMPPREVLKAASFSEALACCRGLGVPGVSIQAFSLRDKIFEVEATSKGIDRVREIHPEVSFRTLKGESLRYSKKTWNGLMLRCGLLAGQGILIPDLLPDCGAAADDVLDATVAAWSARRIACSKAKCFPASPISAPDGRRIAIWH